MRRRAHPRLAYFVHPDLIEDGPKRDLYIWLRALAISNGRLTRQMIIDESVRQPTAPLHDALTVDPAALVNKARGLIVQQKIRMLVFTPSSGPTDRKYRVFVSALVGGVRELVETPWLVTQVPLMREVLARAASFREAWERHRQNMLALQRLPHRQQYWRT